MNRSVLQRFPIVRPGKQALIVPVLAGTLVPVGVLVGMAMNPETAVPWPSLLLIAAMPLFACLIALDMFRREARLEDGKLVVRALPWRSRIPVGELDAERAEIVDLDARAELVPRLKLAGARLPGYLAGIFRLRDKRRATVLLTDRRRVLLLPRRDGSVLLLSLQQPEALLRALRRM